MYFKSRVAAGQILADQIAKRYQDKPCAVVALNDGGVMVGAQIAMRLHAVLMLLMSDTIDLPREDRAIGGISSDGSFSYNNDFSDYELEDIVSEYHGVIEQEKLEKLQALHQLSGEGGLVRKDLLRGRNVILVVDGLQDGFTLDLAKEFLKPIDIKRLLVATPLANVAAVDRMHVLADEIFCLSVVEEYISTDHYYETQDVPDHDLVLKTVKQIVSNWQ